MNSSKSVSANLKEEILQRLNIADVISGYMHLQKKDARYWGLCPFHGEKTPSFCVTPSKNLFYCFGCHKGGDLYTFIMEVEKINFMEALRLLAKKAGVELDKQEDGEDFKKRHAYLELYKKVAKVFQYLLEQSPEAKKAQAYLKKRGIRQETIQTYKLGYAPEDKNWLFNFLTSKDYSKDFLKESGLFKVHEVNATFWPYFRGRLIFPISNHRGEVIAFGGRQLKDEGPKYLNSPETILFKKSDNLFGIELALNSIKKENIFYMVEGYMDVLGLFQAGYTNVVAPLGTAFTENQAKLLKRYVNNGILVFDGDEAGYKAARKSAFVCEACGLEAKIVPLPEDTDPADLQQKDPNTLQKLLKYPINSFQYLLHYALSQFDAHTPEGKVDIVKSLIPFINCMESEIKKEGYFTLLAEALKIDKSSILAEYSKEYSIKHKKSYQYVEQSEKNKREIVTERKIVNKKEDRQRQSKNSIDLYLMFAVLANPEYFKVVRNELSLEDFRDPNAKQIYLTLEECFRKDIFSFDSIIENLGEEELRQMIVKKLSSEEFDINLDKVISDGIRRIKTRNLKLKREKIANLLRQYEKTEPWKLKDLLVEKMVIDKEIEELKVTNHD
jgi:DNA primase